MNPNLHSLIAAILIGGIFAVLYAAVILCYRLLFTKNQDEYPVKYNAKISKKTKSQGKDGNDINKPESAGRTCEDVADAYAEVIDDFPTYHRNK